MSRVGAKTLEEGDQNMPGEVVDRVVPRSAACGLRSVV